MHDPKHPELPLIILNQTFHNHMLRNRNSLELNFVVLVLVGLLVGNYRTVNKNQTGSKMPSQSLAASCCLIFYRFCCPRWPSYSKIWFIDMTHIIWVIYADILPWDFELLAILCQFLEFFFPVPFLYFRHFSTFDCIYWNV